MNLRRVRLILWALVGVAAIGSVGIAIYHARQGTVPKAKPASVSADQNSPLVGSHLPQLDLVSMDGKPVSSDQFLGRPVLLNFWATWCIPCRAEMPDLQHEANAWGDRVAVVGVDDGEDAATIRTFLDQLGITYTIWRDPKGQVDSLLKAPGLPYSIFLDKGGTVRQVHLGQMDRQYVDDRFKELTGA